MKVFSVSLLFAVFFVALAFAQKSSYEEESWNDIDAADADDAPPALPRITCDLLSFGGKVGHAACAAHCLLKGHRGGYCDSRGVCNCR